MITGSLMDWGGADGGGGIVSRHFGARACGFYSMRIHIRIYTNILYNIHR